MGEGGVKKTGKITDVFYGWSLISALSPCKTKVTSDIFHKLRTVTKFLTQGQLDLRRFIENKTPLDSKKKTSHVTLLFY